MPTTRVLVFLCFSLFVGALGEAQILKVRFKDEKAAKKFKQHTADLGGEVVFLGQPVPQGGILLDYKDVELAGVSFKINADNDFLTTTGTPFSTR